MPSVSKSQQRLMGMVHAYKQGDLEIKDLPAGLVKKIKGIADGQKKKTGDKRKKTHGMSDKDAKDFASTKHKGLPEKVKESVGGGVSLNQELRDSYIEEILYSTMDDRKDLERMTDDQLEDKYYQVLDFLRVRPIDPNAGMQEWKPEDEEENERIITRFDKFINESLGDPYDFFDKYEITAGGASGAIEYGFIDVHIDEIDDDIQFEIEQDMNGNVKIELRDNLDGDKLEKVIDILREYGVDIDAKSLRIEDEDTIGAIMREYAQLS